MKKLLVTILSLGFLGLTAQVKDRIQYNHQELKIVVKNDQKKASAKRNLGTGWFDYVSAYSDFNGSALENEAFVSWIRPDTNVYNVGTDGTKNKLGFHVVGRVNDPRDEVYSGAPVRFSRHNTYTWDSIRFTQFYVRFEDSMKVGANTVPVVDTLFIQYFMPSGLDNLAYNYQATPTITHYYSCPKRASYNKNTRLNSAAFKTDTVFLTEDFADSIDLQEGRVFGRSLSIGVGATVPHNSTTNPYASIVGHSIFFKPMKGSTLGDTGLAFDGSTVYNKHNMYGLRMFAKTGLVVDNTIQMAQNNSFMANFQVANGVDVGIFSSYLPGVIFDNTIFESTEYHLTSNTVSVETVDALGNGIGNIYPNPSNSANEIFVPVKISNNQSITLTICDVTGKVVKTFTSDYAAGDFDIAVSTVDMSKGLYTCTMVSGDFKATSKFILN
jgi:hypothetical protein